MTRTPEQKAADDALTAAIEGCFNAYVAPDEHHWVMSEYVVILARQTYDSDGDGITAVASLFRDGDVPTHRAIGLLEYVRDRLRNPGQDGDD